MDRATSTRIGRPSRRSRLGLGLILLAAFSSCRYARPQPGVQLSSTPPGARVSVDGSFSGFVTPARIDLATDDWHVVAVELDGYRTQTRLVGPGTRLIAVDWRQASVGLTDSFLFPLLLPVESVLPLAVVARSEPQRLHFHLRRAAPGDE